MSEYSIKNVRVGTPGGPMQIARALVRVAAVCAATLLVACAKPVAPPASYVGEWRAENVQLAISAAGDVHYLRVRGSGRTSIDAPIQAFEGDDFIVGFGPFKTRFVVSKPPHREGNVWKMTVDGVELVRGLAPGDTTA